MKKKIDFVICFAQMLQKIAEQTAGTEYEETFGAVAKAVSDDFDTGDIFDVAFELQMCDADKTMPESVKEFLMMVYQLGIDEGNAICMNNMGCLYYTDRCGMQDYVKAREYYEMAVKAGYPLSVENLAYIYYYGFGTEVDYEKAYKYFSMAALQGQIEALYKVGDMFRYGYYVDKSEVTALDLYKEAYERYCKTENCKCGGNITKRMGDLFYLGLGTDPNLSMALMFYQRAEQLFYEQIRGGDPFVQKDLEYVIKAQAKIRRQIVKDLPPLAWSVSKSQKDGFKTA
ncbi:MAG: sel1 repeat family protein [Lachnospiraceae bacterium]|nr:sel1 repeat family protein [Lachnospiraceae bacterium]